jgi:hypothetical protein
MKVYVGGALFVCYSKGVNVMKHLVGCGLKDYVFVGLFVALQSVLVF